MSVNIQKNGQLQKIAAQTLVFDANCSEIRSGSYSIDCVSDSGANATITFSTPMTATDYVVVFEQNSPAAGEIGFRSRTTTGFNLFVLGGRSGASEVMTFSGTYYAFRLVTLDGYTALQNKVNNPDSTPTANSTNLCESGGIYDAIKNASSVFIGTADEWDDEQNKTDYQLAVLTDTERINTVDDTTGDIDAVADYSGIWTGSKGDWDELTSAEKAEYKIVNIIDDESGGEYQYSTSEQYTGKKWIDGKKIYQKTINFGALPNASTKDVNHNISGIDKIINYYGFAQTSGGSYLCLPYASTTLSTAVQLWANSTLVRAITGTDRTDYSGYITLEYTKN